MPDQSLLWIADDPFTAEEWPLFSTSYTVQSQSVRDSLTALQRSHYAAIVLRQLPVSGPYLELFENVQILAPSTPVLILSGRQNSDERQMHDLIRVAQQTTRKNWESLLIGESHEMRQVRHIIHIVAGRRATVLVTGETGTGKELAARALHLAGERRRGPWIAVNCSALPDNLLEAELFGHVKGAFTGAIQSRAGRFEEAHGGTLFLDEIGDLALGLQAKLLRVVQERELQRLGTSETIHIDIRLVAATNCDLARRVEEGRFREDLYYRLNVVPLRMPSLRERRDDIPVLAAHFVQKICRLENLPCKSLTPPAVERLCHSSWPGNVRQLENAVEMAIALSGERGVLDAGDFPLPAPAPVAMPVGIREPVIAVPDQGMDYEQTVASIERSILEQALEKTGGNKKAAADMLGLKRTTLSAKVRSLAPAEVCN